LKRLAYDPDGQSSKTFCNKLKYKYRYEFPWNYDHRNILNKKKGNTKWLIQ